VEPVLRITQFYAFTPRIAKGEPGKICYGVEHAKSVRLDPPVEKLSPAYVNCFDVHPVQNTTYTLTAQDESGKSLSESVQVEVGPPLPKLFDLSVSALEVHRGDLVRVCYKASHAKSVRAGPGEPFGAHLAQSGCVTDHPVKTTTYTITAIGADGETDSQQITVQVR
jgi:hypothetical protein